MNRDEIIRMAREAGLEDEVLVPWAYEINMFAALVAAHIRETEFKPDWNNYRQGLADGAAEEREACAKVCEEYESDMGYGQPQKCADAIRARGQQ